MSDLRHLILLILSSGCLMAAAEGAAESPDDGPSRPAAFPKAPGSYAPADPAGRRPAGVVEGHAGTNEGCLSLSFAHACVNTRTHKHTHAQTHTRS